MRVFFCRIKIRITHLHYNYYGNWNFDASNVKYLRRVEIWITPYSLKNILEPLHSDVQFTRNPEIQISSCNSFFSNLTFLFSSSRTSITASYRVTEMLLGLEDSSFNAAFKNWKQKSTSTCFTLRQSFSNLVTYYNENKFTSYLDKSELAYNSERSSARVDKDVRGKIQKKQESNYLRRGK